MLICNEFNYEFYLEMNFNSTNTSLKMIHLTSVSQASDAKCNHDLATPASCSNPQIEASKICQLTDISDARIWPWRTWTFREKSELVGSTTATEIVHPSDFNEFNRPSILRRLVNGVKMEMIVKYGTRNKEI